MSLNIEPLFQDIDNNRNHMAKIHERAYKAYIIHDICLKFHLSRPKTLYLLKHDNNNLGIVNLNARAYAYRKALAELEIWSDNINHNFLLRFMIGKTNSKNVFVRLLISHKDLIYNKYSRKNYAEIKKLYRKWM